MPLLNRRRLLASKIETTYATDPVPTGAANAILVSDLELTPQDADFADRALIRPYLGRSEQLPAGIRAMVKAGVELQGSGTAGTAPGWGPLLRACGFAETTLAAAVTGTATAGSATTITLAAGASSVDGFYVGMPIRITGGTGSGQSAFIAAYVGSTKVATLSATLGTPLNATSVYSIDACVVYKPISTGFESIAHYFQLDGVQHKLLGSRGSVSLSMKKKEIPKLNFEFTGLYSAVTDAALFTPTFTAFKTPLPVTNINTGGLVIHGFTGAVLSSLDLDVANTIVHRDLVGGSQAVLITDREPSGSVMIESTLVAAKDWWTAAQSALLNTLSITHGTTAGSKVAINSFNTQITNPRYADEDGVSMLQMDTQFIPSSAGNDELYITVF